VVEGRGSPRSSDFARNCMSLDCFCYRFVDGFVDGFVGRFVDGFVGRFVDRLVRNVALQLHFELKNSNTHHYKE